MIEKVSVEKWCISCRNCETVCPKIFKVKWTSEVISDNFVWNETEILMAEAMCPVNVIKVDKLKWLSLNFKTAILKQKTFLTQDIIELIFETEEVIKYKAWQYVSVLFEDWKWKFSRQYSLCEVEDKKFSLTIKLYPKWRWAKQIKKISLWQKINFLWPLWDFVLQDTVLPKYFISTWTWLAPFINMAKNSKSWTELNFIVWARKFSDFYYLDKINNFSNAKINLFTSKEKHEKTTFWRVSQFLSNIPKTWVEIYVCGNPQMLEDVKKYFKENNYDMKNVFYEAFVSSWKNLSFFKEIFLNWNIPFVKQISYFVIFLAYFISFVYIYHLYAWISLYSWIPFGWWIQNILFQTSWLALVFVMFIRPLSDIFSKNKFLRGILVFRKPFWILSSFLIITNFTAKWIFDPSLIINYFTTATRWNNFLWISARISEISAIILFLTSNTFSQQKLWKYWKKIQYLSYPYFVTWAIIAWHFEQNLLNKMYYYFPVLLRLVLLVVSYFFRKK